MLRLRPILLASLTLSLVALVTGCDPDKDDGASDEAEAAGDGDGDGDEQPLEPETCDEYAAARACDDGEGTQFCSAGETELVWGACLTDFVCMPGESKSCGLGEEFGDPQVTCVITDGVPEWDPNACNTPLVLSFDAGPIETSASAAVFDISGAGECLSTDWPTARNPWLAADLDKNGSIDGGHELFGSGTVLATGRHARNGFAALASFDSNHDGKVDASDERFGELLVWRDEDADKRSLPYELTALADEGVHSIALGYEVAEQCDARGNCGRERSSFTFTAGSGPTRVGEVVDVYLTCQ